MLSNGERLFDYVAGQEFERHPASGCLGVEARYRHKTRVRGKHPERVLVEEVVETERQGDPDRAPNDRLTKFHLVRLAMKDPEVQGKQEKNEPAKCRVEPPVVSERE